MEIKNKKSCTAIVLAAGSGSRMKSSVAKQYMLVKGKPLICYALQTVEESAVIDECILVTAEADIPYMQREIVEKYGFSKVSAVIAGGAERYLSVANACRRLAEREQNFDRSGYVFIHDGARPFLTEQILQDTYGAVVKCGACVAAVPVKDTIKIADAEGFAVSTPDRRLVWNVQTPQVFEAELIIEAYEALRRELPRIQEKGISITDDASVVELFTDKKVKLVEGSYENIKITTPEDIKMAEVLLKK